jgi:glucose uptake protein GlcU
MSNETETNPLQPRNYRVVRALAVACMLIVAITVLIAGVLFSSYRDTVEREETNLHNLAAAFAAQVR